MSRLFLKYANSNNIKLVSSNHKFTATHFHKLQQVIAFNLLATVIISYKKFLF